MLIFDFNSESNISDWNITDDVVMGGKSNGHFVIDGEGHGVFKGEVSTENNGGFSSVKYQFEPKNIEGYSVIVLNLKGDTNLYQFRVKSEFNQRHSYIYKFETTSEWETIEIPLSELKPVFRGKQLDLPNFSSKVMVEVAFLIANKQNQSFQLKLASICLK